MEIPSVWITGAHMIVYSTDTEADHAFFGDILGLASIERAERVPDQGCSAGKIGTQGALMTFGVTISERGSDS